MSVRPETRCEAEAGRRCDSLVSSAIEPPSFATSANAQARDAALHKVRIRLGDAFLEAEEFSKATAEYRAALLLLEGAPPTDRRLPAVLEAMGQVR
jgi:hypothetical protein